MKNDKKKSHSKKVRAKKVRISPKANNEVFFVESYDRTPPPLDVFQCDLCENYILEERYHCKVCEDYDLCPACMEKKQHEHDDFEIVAPDKEE